MLSSDPKNLTQIVLQTDVYYFQPQLQNKNTILLIKFIKALGTHAVVKSHI